MRGLRWKVEYVSVCFEELCLTSCIFCISLRNCYQVIIVYLNWIFSSRWSESWKFYNLLHIFSTLLFLQIIWTPILQWTCFQWCWLVLFPQGEAFSLFFISTNQYWTLSNLETQFQERLLSNRTRTGWQRQPDWCLRLLTFHVLCQFCMAH